MVGAVAGTPGTAPTNWSLGTSNGGISREIVGVGVEDGISYVDIRWYGTVTTNPIAYWSFNPESDNNNFPGTNTVRYTFSNYIKVVGGTVPVTSNFIMVYYNMNSSFQNLQQYQVLNIPLSNTIGKKLIENRYSFTNSNFSDATTAYLRPYYQWNFYFNEVIDITLRIGMPQVELGSFSTSVIPTSGSTVTRTADFARITGTNFSSWYNPNEGTVYAESIFTNTISFNTVYCLGDGTSNNRTRTIQWNNGTNRSLTINVGGEDQVNIVGTGGVGLFKFAAALKQNDFAVSQNGTTPSVDTSGLMTVADKLFIGSTDGSVFFLNGYLRRLTYYPVRLPNQILQNLTK
jgi:hypothetical protein